MKHGTTTRYDRGRCRCIPCTAAAAAYRKSYRDRILRGDHELPPLDWAICARGGSEAQAAAHRRRGQTPCAGCRREESAAHERRRIRRTVATVTAAAVLALAGCTTPPTSGKVVEHKFTAAWVQYIPGSAGTAGSCSGTGTTRVCTPGTPAEPPQTIYWPDNWSLRLDDQHGNVGDREVDPQEYHSCHDGDHYPECAQNGDHSA